MALTTEQQEQVARSITRQHYGELGNTATLTVTDWAAAVASCDEFVEENQDAFFANLPEPFRSTSTLDEKRLLFVRVVMSRVGLG